MPPFRTIQPIGSPPIPQKKSSNPNGYIIFYSEFYKKILDTKLIAARKSYKSRWKVEFITQWVEKLIDLANTKRLLKNCPPPMEKNLVVNSRPKSRTDKLRVILDDRCYKIVCLNESLNEIPSQESEDCTFNRMFDEFIVEDAYV